MPPETSNYRKILGKNIKICRRRLGWTQERLAESCGLYRSYLSRVEGGTANPTLTVLFRIAAELDEDICSLFLEQNHGGGNCPIGPRAT